MIEISFHDGAATVALNRPEQHNALTQEMMLALHRAFQELGGDPAVRLIVLTGRGRSFCAGADVNMMRAEADNTFDQNVANAEMIFDLMAAVDACPKPVLGRINGAAIGGGVGLVACCDIAVAVERARFGLSEVRLGIVPAVISPFVIAKIGPSAARELFLTGERFTAEHARRIGLVHHVAADESALDERIAERAAELRQGSPMAQAVAKALVSRIAGGDLAAQRRYTTRLIAECRASADGREGMGSFLEKREPRWQAGGSENGERGTGQEAR